MHAQKIAIVGGGPAGSFVAAELARAGCGVLLFEEKLAWEKPCGGGLTHRALARWPFLLEAAIERNWIDACQLVAPSGRKVSFELDRQIAIFSRLALNGLLLDRARSAGAQIIRERIVEINRGPGSWSLKSGQASYSADFVVLAAGARNSLRGQLSSALGPENIIIAAGYYIPGTHHKVHLKFLQGLQGYIWVFPRDNHFSVGICGRIEGANTAELRRLLEACLPEFGLALDGARFYAHVIPCLTVNALRNSRFSGRGWALVGDAAGFVDVITGEGIYYALRSAELLTQALIIEKPEIYVDLLKEELLPELEIAARIADRFYAGKWMGGPVIERMVQLTARSPRFRDLMRDLFSGSQDYATLKQRLYRSLPKIAAEVLVSTLWQREQKIFVASLTAEEREDQLVGAGNRT